MDLVRRTAVRPRDPAICDPCDRYDPMDPMTP
jgi:hypothetical protein